MPLLRRHFSTPLGLLALYNECRNRPATYGTYDAPKGAAALENGTERHNAQIAKLWDTLWENVPSLRNTWQLSRTGAFPSVPAFLAGEPENMWHPQRVQESFAPLRIWVGVTSSGGLEKEHLIKRGAALTVFAQALSEVRPVLLTPYTACGERYLDNHDGDVILSWDIQTSPLILSEVAASLCEPTVSRDVVFKITDAISPVGGWSGSWAYKFDDEKEMRLLLGADEDDLWLGSIHLYDELVMNPVKWIQRHLETYLQGKDDA